LRVQPEFLAGENGSCSCQVTPTPATRGQRIYREEVKMRAEKRDDGDKLSTAEKMHRIIIELVGLGDSGHRYHVSSGGSTLIEGSRVLSRPAGRRPFQTAIAQA
jgi:hypothetical protein